MIIIMHNHEMNCHYNVDNTLCIEEFLLLEDTFFDWMDCYKLNLLPLNATANFNLKYVVNLGPIGATTIIINNEELSLNLNSMKSYNIEKHRKKTEFRISYNSKAEGVHLDRDVSPEGLRSHVSRGAKHCGGLDEGGRVGASTTQPHKPKVTNLGKVVIKPCHSFTHKVHHTIQKK